MDPVMSASAIAMQHRAPQACTSCRRLKRKCVFNPALGICNRCSETSRSCVYAEVNPTAPHDDSVAVVHHNASTTSMNAGAAKTYTSCAALTPSTDASGHLDASLHQGNPLYLATFSTLPVPPGWLNDFVQPNVPSNGSHAVDMGPGSGGMSAYPSTHPGGQDMTRAFMTAAAVFFDRMDSFEF
ncbi:uncharacterized protein F5891DRAFT_975027 [Suillus fuscotomentosus]|uniref:Zn(2)-C6 fungal-type domain-containing protein n=1 Tax=Suillus fuscotomentosus TaxID=1912939 RepID=A0AAD4EJL4_9AGAM|nr:uncharacterized protein F5891DRAFT_975027 [Suillus fuscotomentosus]KAG1907296.1 hypothetical protein F5891DRAFT_975027 [Suillus fuscotomentosus]